MIPRLPDLPRLVRGFDAALLLLIITTVVYYLRTGSPANDSLQGLVYLLIPGAAVLVTRLWLSAVHAQSATRLTAAERHTNLVWTWQPWLLAAAFLAYQLQNLAGTGTSADERLQVAVFTVVFTLIALAIWWFFSRAVRDWIHAATQSLLSGQTRVPSPVRKRLLAWLAWSKVLAIVVVAGYAVGFALDIALGRSSALHAIVRIAELAEAAVFLLVISWSQRLVQHSFVQR